MLYLDKPDCTAQAVASFKLIPDCQYLDESLGLSPLVSMECDCSEELDETGNNIACLENSDCINRLTLIECDDDNCNCGENCQNQRFQKHQFADITVFSTDKKGFGIRADQELVTNDFIIEYIGEILDEAELHQRLIEYDNKKLKHFYFMMLQNNEFIDATQKGSIARFINHSCNPNAYVNKWIVNGKLKMGIFAKRTIEKGEEITFNYNVDRYGATPQKCYCGESNCVGILGGKTQTTEEHPSQLLPYAIAKGLDVTRTMERNWIKEQKKLGNEINTVDNVNSLFLEQLEISECTDPDDITKVITALIQVNANQIMAMEKLLTRLISTTDIDCLQQVIKLHGYACFARILPMLMTVDNRNENEENLLQESLEFIYRLPKTTKNGILTSKLDEIVKKIGMEYPLLKPNCDKIFKKWESYEVYNQISKIKSSDRKPSNLVRKTLKMTRLPPGWEMIQENGRPVYYNKEQNTKLFYPPSGTSRVFSNSNSNSRTSISVLKSQSPIPIEKNNERKHKLSDEDFAQRKKLFIERERKNLERAKSAEKRKLEANLQLEHQKKLQLQEIINQAQSSDYKQKILSESKKSNKSSSSLSNNNYSPSIDSSKIKKHNNDSLSKRWDSFFVQVVPGMIRKYEHEGIIDHKQAKLCCKDIVKQLSSKEISRNENKLPPTDVSKEKKVKIYKFTKNYMERWITKYKK